MLFSAIEDAVVTGETELGVLIHENRFTFEKKGLHQVMDLGNFWEKHTSVPIPLGGIAVKESIPDAVRRKIDQLIAKSLLRAQQQDLISEFVRNHAQSMEQSVMRQHIGLYVNDYTLSLGPAGKKAIRTLYEVYQKLNEGHLPDMGSERFFLDSH